MLKGIPDKLARFTRNHSWWFVLIILALTAAMVPGILMLETETGLDMLVSSKSQVFQDNASYEENFGGEPITILLEGQTEDILSAENLQTLALFEQVISVDGRYKSVISPVTVLQMAAAEVLQARQALEAEMYQAQEDAAEQAIQEAVDMGLGDIDQQLAAEQARSQVAAQYQPYLDALYQTGEPSLDNPLFVNSVLYNEDGSVNPQISSMIPDEQHALLIVTPAGNMDSETALDAVHNLDDFFGQHQLNNVTAKVISDVMIIEAITKGIGSSMMLLLALSLGIMALIVYLTFRVRWRLLSLLIVGFGAALAFGIMGYVGVPISMATMAVLPILIGLGIDYSIQFHNRYQEELTQSSSASEAVVTSMAKMLPVVALSLVATVIGFVTLYISEVPMIRDFGFILAVGVALCFMLAVFLLHSIVYLGDRKTPVTKLSRASAEASGKIETILSWVGRTALKHPLPILLIALAVAITGGVLDQKLPVNSDFEQLMPQDITELENVRQLREITGVGGELRFMVQADDVTDAEFLQWLMYFQTQELANYDEILSFNSLASLVSQAAGGVIPDQQQVDTILANIPQLYREQVASSDGKMASVSFTLEYMTLEEIHDLLILVEQDAQLPQDVSMAAVGSYAIGVLTVDSITGNRLVMNILCLTAIFLVLLIVYRRLTSTIFTIIPVGMVIAWTSCDMYLLGIPLNPLTAIMGVIVIGIGTEFMVLLLGRYEEEKQKGEPPAEAMVTALSKIGRAIVVTAVTTLGGFGVLIVSNFVVIRDFGIAAVISVLLCLISTITVMPPLIVWLDKRIPKTKKRI